LLSPEELDAWRRERAASEGDQEERHQGRSPAR
jgi:hypothetical protein